MSSGRFRQKGGGAAPRVRAPPPPPDEFLTIKLAKSDPTVRIGISFERNDAAATAAPQRAIVKALHPGGLAAAAGVTPGDEVTTINGVEIGGSLQAAAMLREAAGVVALRVRRPTAPPDVVSAPSSSAAHAAAVPRLSFGAAPAPAPAAAAGRGGDRDRGRGDDGDDEEENELEQLTARALKSIGDFFSGPAGGGGGLLDKLARLFNGEEHDAATRMAAIWRGHAVRAAARRRAMQLDAEAAELERTQARPPPEAPRAHIDHTSHIPHPIPHLIPHRIPHLLHTPPQVRHQRLRAMQFIAAVVLQAHTRGFIDRQWVAMLRVEAARRKQREAEQRCASGRVSNTQRAAHGPRLLPVLTPLLRPRLQVPLRSGERRAGQTDVANEQGEARLLVHQKAARRGGGGGGGGGGGRGGWESPRATAQSPRSAAYDLSSPSPRASPRASAADAGTPTTPRSVKRSLSWGKRRSSESVVPGAPLPMTTLEHVVGGRMKGPLGSQDRFEKKEAAL